MYARILTSTPKRESIDTAIAEWSETMTPLKGKNGLVTGYLLVDREAPRFLSITIWESKEAQEKNSVSPAQAKLRADFREHLTGPATPNAYEIGVSLG